MLCVLILSLSNGIESQIRNADLAEELFTTILFTLRVFPRRLSKKIYFVLFEMSELVFQPLKYVE